MRTTLTVALLSLLTNFAAAQVVKPDINESKEHPGVIHSPSAQSTPSVFRSVMHIEFVIKEKDAEAAVRYADGVVVSRDGLIVACIDEANSKLMIEDIQAATILPLDGGGVSAKVLKYDGPHGLAVLRVDGLKLPALELSTSPLAAKRRLSWHAVYRSGPKTILYSRALQVHKAKVAVGDVDDLCEIIDVASHSSLMAERSGSALLSLDGRLAAVMGRQPHWNVSPKSVQPRTKVAIAIPASVIAQVAQDVLDD